MVIVAVAGIVARVRVSEAPGSALLASLRPLEE